MITLHSIISNVLDEKFCTFEDFSLPPIVDRDRQY